MEGNIVGLFDTERGLGVYYDDVEPAIVVKRAGHRDIRLRCQKMDDIEPGERDCLALAYTGQALVLIGLMDPEERYGDITARDAIVLLASVVHGDNLIEKAVRLSDFVSEIIEELGYECCNSLVRASNFVLDVASCSRGDASGAA